MKTFLGLLLALLMLLGCAACGQSPAPTESSVPAETPAPTETPVPAESGESAAELVFSTTDREGAVWDQSKLAGYSLVMLNFWEPWCPPCVGEMPDLARLSAAYAERGLLILGVYSTEGVEEDVDAVLADCGANYPILHYTEAFDVFQSGYVPTTVFLNAAGETVGERYIGARSYEAWAEIVEGLL